MRVPFPAATITTDTMREVSLSNAGQRKQLRSRLKPGGVIISWWSKRGG